MAKKKIRSIVVVATRWFNKATGNTYHSASMVVDGHPMGGTGVRYGYGDQYIYTAFSQLKYIGLLKDFQERGIRENEAPWRYCEARGIKLTQYAIDVARKRDMVGVVE